MSTIALVLFGTLYGLVGLIVAGATILEGRTKGFRVLPHLLLSVALGLTWPAVTAAVFVAARRAGLEADAVERPDPGHRGQSRMACSSLAA